MLGPGTSAGVLVPVELGAGLGQTDESGLDSLLPEGPEDGSRLRGGLCEVRAAVKVLWREEEDGRDLV